MNDQAYQTLYGMLLGEPPYERHGAPEPGLLFELVPVLPEGVLAEAVWGVAGMEIIWPSQRQRLLAALLERAAGAGQSDLLAQAIVRLLEVVPHLAESILPQALDAVRAFEWWDEPARATALVLLAARASTPSLEDVLAAARAPIDYGDRQRAPALAAAISGLEPPLSQEAIADLLDAARAMQEGTARGTVFTGLLAHLDESTRSSVAREALDAFRSADERSPERAEALAALSQQLPDPLQGQVLDQAVEEARGLAYGDEQARALVAIAGQVGEPLAGELLLEIHSLDIPDRDLISLAPYLSEAQLERALQALPYEPAMLENALSELVPYLPDHLLVAAMHDLDQEESRPAVVKALASHVLSSLYPRALSKTLALLGSWARRYGLGELLPLVPDSVPGDHLPPPEGTLVLPSAGQIRELWASLPPAQQSSLAGDVIHATCGYYGGAEAAPPPEPALPEPDRPPRPPSPEEPPGPTFPREIERPGIDEVWRSIDEPEDRGSLASKGLSAEERLVNTGFSTPSRAGLPIDPEQPLAPDRTYYFWFQVGRRVAGAIDVEAVRLPTELLPARARLTVALYAFEGELRLTDGQDVGEIQVQSDLSVRVVRPVNPKGAPDSLWPDDPLQEKRCLFFPVATPAPGLHRLRCNVYYEGILVQSHLVQALVAEPGTRSLVDVNALPERALAARCDYTLSNTLRPEVLTRIEPHRLSLLINDNGDGTHGFRFFARDEASDDPRDVKHDSTFDGQQLQHLIDLARGAMRRVSWGDEEPWDWRKMYRYGGRLDQDRIEQVQSDLILLARQGYSFYDATINELASGASSSAREIHRRIVALQELMLTPGGLIQVASKESVRHVVPLALFYDYGLDPAAPDESFSLCPEFLQALRQRTPLSETLCFQGACPSRGNLSVVCPSGFWGYRHGIGMPVSIGGELKDAVTEIAVHGAPQVTMAVSTDERLRNRVEHESELRALRDDVMWHRADTRDETLELMGTEPAHIVYFYCHGGVTESKLPYIEVGQPDTGRITSGLMRAKRLFWDQPRPLVFINGCHTTALEPEVAFDLVKTFVETVGAAGVIGTEITIYEPLAVAFGEACLKRFVDGTSIGEAVRQARLELLQQGNPLGLVYDAFAIASLKMIPAS